jgi:hypothetical protein
MAKSTRNGRQRRAPSQVDPYPQEPPETAEPISGAMDESRSTLETPTLWHGGPRSECWTSSSVAASGSWGSPFAAPGRPVLRLRRLPRRRTPLHCSRPVQRAAERLISHRAEFLAD